MKSLEEWLIVRSARCAPATVTNDRALIRRLSAHVGPMQIGSLTPQHVEDFFFGAGGILYNRRGGINSPKDGMLKASSYNKAADRARQFLLFAQGRGYIRRDLMINVKDRPVMQRQRLLLTQRLPSR